VLLENDVLTLTTNEVDAAEYSRSATQGFARPPSIVRQVPFANAEAPHAQLLGNFVSAILDGTVLIAPGEEGLHSVELANAMLYSSWTNDMVALPLDALDYERQLKEKIAGSSVSKQPVVVTTDDFTGSFRR
jgi:hypothetical protein